MRAHPDFASRTWDAAGCAPLLIVGAMVETLRDRLAARAHLAAWGSQALHSPVTRIG
jgi:hypothetical protein